MESHNTETTTRLADVGMVVIGRNEGDRLKAGLRSVPPSIGPVVYVDSGSTDDSVEFANSLGVNVVELDIRAGFTAARARNAGFRHLLHILPSCRYVQFMDGDCYLATDWIRTAVSHLDRHEDTVAVWGSRREVDAEDKLLNAVCDIEWNQASAGETKAFGGDVMLRRDALEAIDGYRDDVIAAEDDEVSIRLRRSGKSIMRLDAPMSFHDASMTRIAQWWKRARRSGYAYALVGSIHGDAPEYYFRGDIKRTILWGFIVPVVGIVGGFWSGWILVAAAALYALRAYRTSAHAQTQGWRPAAARAWGVSCSLSPFPQFAGLLAYHLDRLRDRAPEIIEYK